jgi:hypothetical protein
MRPALLLCALTSTTALLAGSALAEPKAGDTALAAPKPEGPTVSYWLAADPHVPLAVVEGKAMHGIGKRGKSCGGPLWTEPNKAWRAVDAWGRFAGDFVVKGSERDDSTTCREVSFLPASDDTKTPAPGLLVSAHSGYQPPKETARYAPSVAEKKRFERFLGAMESAFVDHRPLGKVVPWGKRTMFFQVTPPKDASWDGRVDGAGKPIERPTRWAVSGGPILVVSYLGEHGQWRAATVKPPLGLTDSYLPVAVFDMNGDGIPEIVYQASDGPSFADTVMALDAAKMAWEDAVESPGGSAL